MPYDRDVQLNPDGSKLDCGKATRPTKGIRRTRRRSALSFLQDSGNAARHIEMRWSPRCMAAGIAASSMAIRS